MIVTSLNVVVFVLPLLPSLFMTSLNVVVVFVLPLLSSLFMTSLNVLDVFFFLTDINLYNL